MNNKKLNSENIHEFVNELLKIKECDDETFVTKAIDILHEWNAAPEPAYPVEEPYVYAKFGFVKTKSMHYHCPACNSILNAGPNYQPERCSHCGQPIDFSKTEWKEEEFLGYTDNSPSHKLTANNS